MKSKYLNYIIPVFLFSIIWGALEFILPIRYSEANISVGLCSILFAISSFFSLLLDLPAGKLSDNIGREKIITFSLLIAALAFIILIFFSSFLSFFIVAVLIGLTYGISWSPLLAFISDRINKNNQGRIFGSYLSLDAIGDVLGPIIIVVIVLCMNSNFSFLALLITTLVCALMFKRLIKPNKKCQPNNKIFFEYFSVKSSLRLVKKTTNKSLFLLTIGFFVSFFWQSVWFTQPLIGFYDHSILDSALIIAVFSIPTILFSPFLGKLIDKTEEKKVFFYSIIVSIISFLFFYFSTSILAKIIYIFVAAIGVLGVKLVMNVLIVKTYNKQKHGEFFGILETVRDVSFIIAPLFIGFTYKVIGLDGVFIVNSFLAILLLIFGLHLFRTSKLLITKTKVALNM